MKKNLNLVDRSIFFLIALFLFYWGHLGFNIYTIIGIYLLVTSLIQYSFIREFLVKKKIIKNEQFYLEQLPKLNPEPVIVFSINGNIIFQNKSSKLNLTNLRSFNCIFKDNIKDIVNEEKSLKTLYQDGDNWYKMFAIGVKENEYVLVYGFTVNSLIETQEQLQQSITTDALTKIGNRRKLNEDVVKLSHSFQALTCMDIIKFGEFNSFYGHNIGDQLLITFANFLKDFSKDNNHVFNVYRLNGNTFALLFHFNPSKENSFKKRVDNQIEVFLSALKKKTFGTLFNIGLDIRVGVSIYTHQPACRENAKKLVIKAETALQESKRRDNSIVFYENIQGVEEGYNHHILISNKLKSILIHKNSSATIMPFFQPIYSLKDKKIKKYEALARLKDGENIIPPNEFLEAAKKIYLLPKITKNIFYKSLQAISQTSFSISINITTQDLEEKSLLEFFELTCKEFNVSHSQVIFEILEDKDVYQHRQPIKDLQNKGFKIAIDDFGIGYSNFKKLQHINADFIKIDGSLIQNINHNSEDLEIVKSISLYAKSIGAQTIAEFVSDEKIYNTLSHLDIDYFQGYYIGKPKPTL